MLSVINKSSRTSLAPAMIRLLVIAAAFLAMPVMSASAQRYSGTFVGFGPDSATMLQLVETPDAHVTGQLSGVEIQANGDLKETNLTVAGAVDRANITMTLHSPVPLPVNTVTLFGTLEGGLLTLNGPVSGGAVRSITLYRGDLAQFQAHAAEIRIDSAKRVAERTAREQQAKQAVEAARQRKAMEDAAAVFSKSVDTLVARMRDAKARTERAFPRLGAGERRAGEITQKMQEFLDRERGLRGDRYGAARAQLTAAITQGSSASIALEGQIQNLKGQFENLHGPLVRELSRIEPQCAGAQQQGAEDSGTPEAIWAAACRRLQNAAPDYRDTANRFVGGLQRLEVVYNAEHVKQERISNEAFGIQ